MAWTTPRTFVDGELENAAIFNTHLRDNLNALPAHTLARKTADESVTSSTTLQDDDHLFFTMGTNQIWMLELVLWLVDGGTGKYKFFATGPASSTWGFQAVQFSVAGTLTSRVFDSVNGQTDTQCTPSAGQVQSWHGYATTGATAGNLQFQWAQSTSSGSATVIKRGSYLAGYQVA